MVLWGPGGVGKTTLAAEAVREMAGVFGKRTVWAGAQNRTDFNFDTLLDVIATQFGRTDLRKFVTDKKAQFARRRRCPPFDRPRESRAQSQGRFLIGRTGLFVSNFIPLTNGILSYF